MRVMAIDYGTKAIGVAICDELQLTVRPLTTIRREKQNQMPPVERVGDLAREHEIGALVVGLPLNMNGTRGDAAEKVEKFVADLRPHLSIPVIFIDERLTSYEADQILREMGVGQKERKAKSDEYAAVLILQDYLDGQLRQQASGSSSSQSFQ
ncbi:MAG: Holliday junction resolvase RuvX [Blastocatellia bacterium]